jgi:predicted HAD superfamily Cof-like phosphohydrolase
MTNPFLDQEKFMEACGQTTDRGNMDQFNMYLKLIEEEAEELNQAIIAKDKLEMLDALVDLLVVTIGAIHSMGSDAEGAWNEVMKTNLAKIDPETGKVRKREDGKVLKPEGWQPPDLKKYLSKDFRILKQGYEQ